MNRIIKFIKIYWISLVLAFVVVGLTAAIIFFVYYVAESFMGMEDFSKKQMGGHMALLLPVFLIVHLVALPVMLAGQFFMLHGGAFAKMLGGSDSHKSENVVKWDEVIGMTVAKLDAWEIVEFLQNKKKLATIGGTNMKGALMYGPPGCGKTYLAKAIATEAGLPFLCTVGSEFIGMVSGLGASRMKSLFKKARRLAKIEGGCIIFIDEIDSFARPRNEDIGGGITTSNNATINQFLTELDGMKLKDDNVFVLAATNVDESKLDPAVVRSGRFDRKIHIQKPTTRERRELLKFYLAKVKYEPQLDIPTISDRLHGFSPADIFSLVKESGALALRKGKNIINVSDFEEAIGRMVNSKAKARSSTTIKSDVSVPWREVIGMDKAKGAAAEIISMLKDRHLTQSIGDNSTHCTLLLGPTGAGKTHLAKAIATESEVPFLSVMGSEFIDRYMNEGPNKMREFFAEARMLAEAEDACLIFIDEIDAFARNRGVNSAVMPNPTLDQFVRELDELRHNQINLFILAATNLSEDELDPSITKIGRFDSKIHVTLPSTNQRIKLLKYFLNDATVLDYDQLAKQTAHFAPGDIKELASAAKLLAAKAKRDEIVLADVENSINEIQVEVRRRNASRMIHHHNIFEWDNVIGLDDVKEQAQEIIAQLKNPEILDTLGEKSSFCTLFMGPSGAGKTLLINALASEVDVPFLSIMGNSFNNYYMNEGAKKMREFFSEARILAQSDKTCLVFIDEIDAFARNRERTWGYIQNPILDQFLKEIDDIKHSKANVIVLAATNVMEEDLDTSIFKFGRFNKRITLDPPQAKERQEILEFYLSQKNYSEDVDVKYLAGKSLSFTPADLANLVTEAGLGALRNKRETIMMSDMTNAISSIHEAVAKRNDIDMANTKVNIPWDDVIGMEETKQNAWEVVELLKDRRKLKVIGGKIIKGLLMVGPPGCGKTYLAKAMATEAGYPFLSVVGSEFVDKYVGEGARKVRQVFGQARSLAKAEGGCIIFFDEIDAFIKPRNNEMNGNTNSENATINQFLAEMDGLGKDDEGHVVILAATNMPPETLDPAVMRSGRFDRRIEILKPSAGDRAELLKFYISRVDAEDDIDVEFLADKSKWFSAADIDNMVREAGIFALRDKREKLTMEDLKNGLHRVLTSLESMGEEKILGDKVNVKWDAVIGMPEAKEEAWEIVKMLQDRNMVKAIGGKIVKGVIMFGPPGCGKTYLAKAMATEAGFPFISRTGSEFVQMFVGEGAKKMRELFKEARAMAKTEGGCIIFMDEIDGFARPRSTDKGFGGTSSMNATINQFLTEMDGLKNEANNIMILAATNAKESEIDPAVLRAGRIERKIYIALPTVDDRKEIFKFYFGNVNIADDVSPERWARIAVGTSPSDIDSMVREAGLIALRGKRETITHKDLMEAYDRITLGAVSRDKHTKKSIMKTAYHEAGHAILTYLVHPSKEVIKATVKPRKGSLGMIQNRSIEELAASSPNREQWYSEIQIMLAGYVAEKLTFGTTASGVGGGPGSDFYTAMNVANYMVRSLGMGDSELIGDFTVMEQWALSERTKQILENDVQKILQDCLKVTTEILTERKDVLEFFAQELMEKGDLEYDDVQAIFNKFSLKPAAVRPAPEESEEKKES